MAKIKTFCAAFAAALSLICWGAIAPAHARPPTVTNSPGYEARLAESRKARTAAQALQPVAKPPQHLRKRKPGKPD